jgi:hypothetical protein
MDWMEPQSHQIICKSPFGKNINPIYLYKDNPLEIIYVNSFNMQIVHISTQPAHATSAPNQHSRGLIGRFPSKSLSFN